MFIKPPDRTTFGLAVFVTLIIFVCGGVSTLNADLTINNTTNNTTNNDNQEKRLKTLKKEISRLQKQLRRTDNKRDKLAAQLRQAELTAADTQLILDKLQVKITVINSELNALTERQKKLSVKKQQQAIVVGRELNAAYRLGQQEPLKLFFNLENPDDISRTLKYYEYMLEARTTILVEYKTTLDEIAELGVNLLEKKAIHKESQARVIESSAVLKKQLEERKQLLSVIGKQLNSDNKRLKNLQVEQNQLEQIIAKLNENIQRAFIPNDAPFVEQRGKLPWPVQGRIRNRFGSLRNANLKWSGWLLDAKQASSVNAIHYGRVVFSDYLRGHGLMLIVDHGEGYLSLYAHNQVLLKETGDWVSAGENIARVGDTGGLQKSALYFEIRHKGKAIDPKPWLKPKA